MASAELTPVERLGEFVANFQLSNTPPDVIAHARQVVLDTLAVMLAASLAPEPTRLAQVIMTQEPGTAATLLRPGFPCTSVATAALANGASGAFLEMDEGHRYFSTHAGIQVIPAALAMAEMLAASGAELLAAVIAGYDAAARTGGATKARAEVNGHGTWATVGAAAACARLLGFDGRQVATALRLAAHLPLATSFRTPMEGATIRNAYVGFAGQSGVRAVQLAQAGFTALPDAAAEVFGKILGTEFSDSVLVDELGQRFEITRNFMKLYACCQYNHATLDALEAVLEQGPLEPQEVEAVFVRTYHPASAMRTPTPVNPLQAKFSIPFAVATRLIHGNAGPEAFDGAAICDPRVLALAERVVVTEAPEMSRGFPLDRPAEVRLRTVKGQERAAYCGNARGDFARPYPRTALLAKARTLASRVLTAHGVEVLIAQAETLDTLPDVRQLIGSLRKHDRQSVAQ